MHANTFSRQPAAALLGGARRQFLGLGLFIISGLGAGWNMPATAALDAIGDAGLRCQVRLPATLGDWNTVRAECDGRPVAIGAPAQLSLAGANLALNSGEYAQDMQMVRGVLSSGPTPTPTWVPVTATLLGIAFFGGLARLLQVAMRRLLSIASRTKTLPSSLVGGPYYRTEAPALIGNPGVEFPRQE